MRRQHAASFFGPRAPRQDMPKPSSVGSHSRPPMWRSAWKLTNGRYSDFEIAEDLTSTVNVQGGYRPREVFSGGTQDQFLIALRLAFTKSILDSRVAADRYCLLMDECISSSDEQRRQGVFEVLDQMKETFPQIFIIAHDDISNFVDYHVTLGRDESGYSNVISKSWER